MDLSNLPVELVPSIVNQVDSRRDLFVLQRVNSSFFVPATRRLYSPKFGPVHLDSQGMRQFGNNERTELYRSVMRSVSIKITRVVRLSVS